MEIRVFYPRKENELYTTYQGEGFSITDGYLTIYATGSKEIMAVYAPGFWTTVENIDEVGKGLTKYTG